MPPKTHKVPPLTASKLEELALSYVARFATTRAKLEAYLIRKLRERGWEGERDPDPAGIAVRFAEVGYVDDASFARLKSENLLRRGYGGRRVGEALRAAGVDESLCDENQPSIFAARKAAVALARRRRFGPWSAVPLDRPVRDKQVAAMLRAGHSLDNALQIVEATELAAVEEWVDSAPDAGDETCE